ncbi:hypothetical protein LCER1_G004268 [Lachnellula cervina]|uniref:Cyclochlorotine biosynthesis protein O n=1 Tax=Lachnellula cervina TaxID=1316786 RepID=A0A7D8UZ13_9HELO|nr:hypothetical protein LCER1_G004268 [Lachnellula cervina]
MSFSKINNDEQEPFLDKHEGEISPKSRKRVWILPSIALFSVVAHLALLLLWRTVWTHPNAMSKTVQKPSQLFKTQIEIWPEDAWDNSVYVGPPSKELDAAWDKLQAVEGISVSPEEVAKLDLKSRVHLKNGDQAAVMGYFHNLHCLRYLYQGLHPDIYVRGGDPGHSGHHHDYHCIEVLRRSVLCQPDFSVHGIHWQHEDKKVGVDLQPESKRECVNFEAVYNYSMTRRFPYDMIVGVEGSAYDTS